MTSPLNVKTTLQAIFNAAIKQQTRVLLYARDTMNQHLFSPAVIAPPNVETWRVDAIVGIVYKRDGDNVAHFAIMGWSREGADETRYLDRVRIFDGSKSK